ncbi:MAG: class I SAM-dependent methyltransferase [Lactobacillales bacterium]|jgi:ubiquinone/menaquinone biosynthesis C-methylase UbiE|nr:class I SAM-dependent methyltransferase [Lactobacillales bacterium]
MDKNTIISTYDAVSKAYAAAFSNPSFHLKDFLDMIKPPARILDIGCGPGNNAAYLSALGYTVVGVDLSENMLALARQKSPGTTFIKQDIAHLDFPESSFDHAVAAYSLC